ncbi:hypothetical protein [Ideonella sp. YS5]|uniref:hypothetical protein n=1 Tax=Ideonella sp. YS5 TaxID=3453714 RepID=UPI003EEF07D9
MSILNTVSHRALACLLLTGAALLGGCAVAPSSPSAMTPETIATAKQSPKTVSVAATGGKGVATDAAMADAVAASIEKAKTFSKVIKGAGADYQLTVTLMSLDMPSFGMSFTCKTEMAWSLKRADGSAAWQEVIKSEGTAGAGEAFVGSERAKMAIERSIRENIAQGLSKISNQNL